MQIICMNGLCLYTLLLVGFSGLSESDGLDEHAFQKDTPEGCILEVDLEFSKELHMISKRITS